MSMVPFASVYRSLGLAETRSFTARGFPGLPDDEYGLLESYCFDPECDCRRVMLNVISKRDAERGRKRVLATIYFAFDRDSDFAGPGLDPLNAQSQYAGQLLEAAKQILADPLYVARLERHYHLAKEAASSPDPSVRKAAAQALAEEGLPPAKGEPDRPPKASASRRKAEGGPVEAPTARPSVGEATESVPRAMRPAFEAIVAITDAFCRTHLNEEYAQLSRKLAAALARKRPSPLSQGKPPVWACGIVYALASVNFLWDKTQTPHMSAGDLCDRFGVGKSSCSTRARSIMSTLGMGQFDPRWTLPSKMDENPFAWMISINGLIVDVRYASREIQEEALQRGLIPYLPKPR